MSRKQKKADVRLFDKCYASTLKNSQKTQPTSTVSLQNYDIKENLPNFELAEIDNFDTIDDNLLLQLMDQHDKQNTNDNSNNNNNNYQPENALVGQPNVPQIPQINTQVINQNVPPQYCIPAMYFPNSNVTINCNFNAKLIFCQRKRVILLKISIFY